MKTTIALFLSLTTMVGGHFFNKRNDRAILFLGIFFSWLVFIATVFPFTYNKLVGSLPDSTFFPVIKIGVLVIWIISALVTYIDSKNVANNDQKTSISGKIGATTLSIFMGIATISTLMSLFQGIEVSDRSITSYQEPIEHNFLHYIGFGGVGYPEPEYSEPPKGPGSIAGKFVYNGSPVKNLELEVTLNGEYKSELVETDSKGEFALKIPYGIWYLNRIYTTSWPGKPPGGRFNILSGQEPTIEEYKKNPHWFPGGNGLQFELTEESPHKKFEFTITPQISLLWPGQRGRELKADKNSIIHWESYPSASKYLVWVQSIESNFPGTNVIYRPALSTVVERVNQLSLSKIITPDDSKNTYQVTVFAFNDEGEYLSESNINYHEGSSFVLKDYKIESEEIKEIKERYNKRINADR